MFNNIFNKIFLDSKFCLISLFITSFIISLLFSINIDQRALNAALIISNKINYSNELNVLNLDYHNSWTIIFQILRISIELGVNIKFLSFFILFTSILLNAFGIYLVSKSISQNNFFSIITPTIILAFQISFGNLDYPTLIISEHTNGMMGSAIVVFIFGLIANQKLGYAIILAILSLSIHLLIGLWLIFIIFLSIIFFNKIEFKYYFNSKRKIIFLMLSLTIVLLSFIFFQLNRIDIPFLYDENLYKLYLEVWEHHRSKIFNINYVYIIFSLILLLFLILIKKENKNLEFFSKIIILHLIISFTIYIIYKIFPDLFQGVFLRIIPSRFFLLHSVLGPAIIFSVAYYYLEKFFKRNNLIIYLLILLLIHPTIYFEKYLKKFNFFYDNWNISNYSDNEFWNKVKKDDISDRIILTSINACSKTIQRSQKPILICIESIDVIPYIPNLIIPIKEIIENIYQIDFKNPPEKNHGGLWYDNSYKTIFENRSFKEWYSISHKYNLGALILPKDWNINLDKKIAGKDYIYYKF